MNRAITFGRCNARRCRQGAAVIAVWVMGFASLALAAAADDTARRVTPGTVTAAPLATQDQVRLQRAETQLTQLRGKIAGLRKKVAAERVKVERSKGVKLPPVIYRSPTQTAPATGTPSTQPRTLVPKQTVPLTVPPATGGTTGTTPASKSSVPLIFKPTLTAPKKDKDKEKSDKGTTQTTP